MNLKTIPYLLILGLLLFILLQNRGCVGGKSPADEIQRDTVIRYITVHDTVPGKPIFRRGKRDTVWVKIPEYLPDTTYAGLLKQYNALGNKHFESRFYTTTFPIGTYGTVTLNDTVKANQLMSSKLVYDLKIPEKTITETKLKSYRQVYVGVGVFGNSLHPIKGIYGSGIFKTKKDYLYGAGIGYDGQVIYQLSLHGPLRIK